MLPNPLVGTVDQANTDLPYRDPQGQEEGRKKRRKPKKEEPPRFQQDGKDHALDIVA